jgi:hypothetical protein
MSGRPPIDRPDVSPAGQQELEHFQRRLAPGGSGGEHGSQRDHGDEAGVDNCRRQDGGFVVGHERELGSHKISVSVVLSALTGRLAAA